MDQVHVIRHKVLVEGASIRSVSRDLGISRVTIRKYLKQSEPRRLEERPRPQPAREAVRPRLEELWSDWRRRSSGKHRVTAAAIHRQLRSDGYEISAVTVRRMVRQLRLAEAEVYVPLVHRPGDSGQVDFFKFTIEVAGERQKAWLFLLHLPASDRSFCRLCERCDQLSFLDAHVRAFEYLGGVPERLIYDNLRAAVKRRSAGSVELSERFQALLSHYTFEACFARPGEGHDKGAVERRGQSIRGMYCVPHPRGDSHAEISDRIQRMIEADWQRSGGKPETLRDLPKSAFDPRSSRSVTVSKSATVRVESAVYSVPTAWARRSVQILIGVDELEISCGSDCLSLPRVARGEKRIDYRHYLPELARKPQAVRQVAPELVQQLGGAYPRLWSWLSESIGSSDAAKVLSRVLQAVLDHGEVAVGDAISAALDEGRLDLLSLREDETRPVVPVPVELTEHVVESTAATSFDGLLSGEAA